MLQYNNTSQEHYLRVMCVWRSIIFNFFSPLEADNFAKLGVTQPPSWHTVMKLDGLGTKGSEVLSPAQCAEQQGSPAEKRASLGEA